jgi:hypothetical protein
LKSAQEAGMDNDQLIIEEIQTPDPSTSPTTWQKIQAFVRGEIAKERMSKEQKLAEAAKLLGVSVKELAGAMGYGEEEDEEKGDKKEKAQKENDTVSDALAKSVEDKLAEIQKAHEAALAAQVEAIEKQYQTKLSELEKKAQDAEVEVQKATEARERREWIEKAEGMSLALPVKREELADHLYAISKAAPEQVEFLTGLLKAADHALTEAGLFNELGTSQVAGEVEPAQKAQQIAKEKGISLEEALLSLPKEDQEAIAKSFLGGGKK